MCRGRVARGFRQFCHSTQPQHRNRGDRHARDGTARSGRDRPMRGTRTRRLPPWAPEGKARRIKLDPSCTAGVALARVGRVEAARSRFPAGAVVRVGRDAAPPRPGRGSRVSRLNGRYLTGDARLRRLQTLRCAAASSTRVDNYDPHLRSGDRSDEDLDRCATAPRGKSRRWRHGSELTRGPSRDRWRVSSACCNAGRASDRPGKPGDGPAHVRERSVARGCSRRRDRAHRIDLHRTK